MRNPPIRVRKEPETQAEIKAEINFLEDKLKYAVSPMSDHIRKRIAELKERLK